MPARSPSGVSPSSRAAGSFSTGSDSPVSADSWIRRFALSKSLPSAGTRFPASSNTTSPGTKFFGRDLPHVALPADLHRGRGHTLQGGHRPLRPVLLGEAQGPR